MAHVRQELLLISPHEDKLFFSFLHVIDIDKYTAHVFASLRIIYRRHGAKAEFPPFIIRSGEAGTALEYLLVRLP